MVVLKYFQMVFQYSRTYDPLSPQPHRGGGRLGQEKSSESLPGPLLCGHQGLQTSCRAIPRHSLHLYLIRAHGLQDICHLHSLCVHDRPQTARPP